jgi:transaldolase
MKFFIDSANIQVIEKFTEMGIVDGVTTNPSLLAKEGANHPIEHLKKILKLVKGPVSIEVVATDYENMLREARAIAKMGSNVAVKLPMTKEGMRVLHTVSKEGINVNVTLVFSAAQALIAAKAGATYVSPFIGRLDDVGANGMDLVRDIVQMFRNYKIETKVLVASVRHPMHVIEAAKLGADIATLPPDVLDKMLLHPLTDIGIKKFLDDWKAVEEKYGNIFKSLK